MRLIEAVLRDLEQHLSSPLDIASLQQRVEASVAAMDNAVPAELRKLLEDFVRDVEVARFTMGADQLSQCVCKLTASLAGSLKSYLESGV